MLSNKSVFASKIKDKDKKRLLVKVCVNMFQLTNAIKKKTLKAALLYEGIFLKRIFIENDP